MSKRVLRTKFIGYATDSSRHPLAPVEIVYQCEEERADFFGWVRDVTPGLIRGLIDVFFLVICPMGLAILLLIKTGWLPS